MEKKLNFWVLFFLPSLSTFKMGLYNSAATFHCQELLPWGTWSTCRGRPWPVCSQTLSLPLWLVDTTPASRTHPQLERYQPIRTICQPIRTNLWWYPRHPAAAPPGSWPTWGRPLRLCPCSGRSIHDIHLEEHIWQWQGNKHGWEPTWESLTKSSWVIQHTRHAVKPKYFT